MDFTLQVLARLLQFWYVSRKVGVCSYFTTVLFLLKVMVFKIFLIFVWFYKALYTSSIINLFTELSWPRSAVGCVMLVLYFLICIEMSLYLSGKHK